MKAVAFFNCTGGIGRTSLVYHLAWMFADKGVSVIAADFDPQASLTAMVLEESRLEEIAEDGHGLTIQGMLESSFTGLPLTLHVEAVSSNLGLIAGNLELAGYEPRMCGLWDADRRNEESAQKVITTFRRAVIDAARIRDAQIVLIDLGPNLGAINRSALLASDFVVVPLVKDLAGIRGLRISGSQLRAWRSDSELPEPSGRMSPAGYVVLRRPGVAERLWAPVSHVYREAVLGVDASSAIMDAADEPDCLSTLRHYRSLMQLASEARKPMFSLKPADGAIGSHVEAVRDCYREFSALADRIADRCGVALP